MRMYGRMQQGRTLDVFYASVSGQTPETPGTYMGKTTLAWMLAALERQVTAMLREGKGRDELQSLTSLTYIYKPSYEKD